MRVVSSPSVRGERRGRGGAETERAREQAAPRAFGASGDRDERAMREKLAERVASLVEEMRDMRAAHKFDLAERAAELAAERRKGERKRGTDGPEVPGGTYEQRGTDEPEGPGEQRGTDEPEGPEGPGEQRGTDGPEEKKGRKGRKASKGTKGTARVRKTQQGKYFLADRLTRDHLGSIHQT